ncbi:MAG TPA: ParA family protein [Blastocatellia bacterium]|nr:ParA family protein [Blastocatellia bacterium]
MKVIALANQKGGVGKTTITRELSACRAMRGFQVLAIGCDSQGSLARSWCETQPEWPTLSNVTTEAFLNSPAQIDIAQCLDCRGQGFYYPNGIGNGPAAKCKHGKLQHQ